MATETENTNKNNHKEERRNVIDIMIDFETFLREPQDRLIWLGDYGDYYNLLPFCVV